MNLEKLVFIDESGAKTNMTRLYGRAKSGQRVQLDGITISGFSERFFLDFHFLFLHKVLRVSMPKKVMLVKQASPTSAVG